MAIKYEDPICRLEVIDSIHPRCVLVLFGNRQNCNPSTSSVFSQSLLPDLILIPLLGMIPWTATGMQHPDLLTN